MSPPLIPLPSPDDPPVLLVNALTGRYRLLRYLGGGAEASVWHAIDQQDGAEVAIKHFPPRPGRRALQEFASLLPLRHPRIVPLRDFAYLPEGDMVIISSYVPGGSLRDQLERTGRIPLPQVFDIAEDILSALAYLHSRDIVHRDVKPDNILVVPATAHAPPRHQLADFGIAGAHQDYGAPSPVAGSPGYLAPEAFTRRIGPAADLYSLGVTLHELLSGERPFDGDPAALARAHLSSPPPRLPDAARPLAPLVLALLEKDPAQRPAHAAAALALLRSLRPGAPNARAEPGASPPRRPTLPLPFVPGSRFVLRSSFSLPGSLDRFGLVTIKDRPALVLDEGSHLALHDAAHGAALRHPLPKSGPAWRTDTPDWVLRAHGRLVIATQIDTLAENTLAELPRACASLAWHEEAGLLAHADDRHLSIENPAGLLRAVHLRLPEGMRSPHLTWLARGDRLAVAGGLLRPEILLHTPSGDLIKSLALPGAVLDAPRHLGAPVWIVLDHGSKARLNALALGDDDTLRPLPLPADVRHIAITPHGLLVMNADGELRHLAPDGREIVVGSVHPGTTELALTADARHLIAARPGASGTEFTLHSHQHA